MCATVFQGNQRYVHRNLLMCGHCKTVLIVQEYVRPKLQALEKAAKRQRLESELQRQAIHNLTELVLSQSAEIKEMIRVFTFEEEDEKWVPVQEQVPRHPYSINPKYTAHLRDSVKAEASVPLEAAKVVEDRGELALAPTAE